MINKFYRIKPKNVNQSVEIIRNVTCNQMLKLAARLSVAVWLTTIGYAPAALVVSTANQNGAMPLTPTWIPATNSLIAGLVPSMALGNFSEEIAGRNVNSLTVGGSLTISSVSSTCSTNYITCGNANGAGSTIIYTLPTFTNGYNLPTSRFTAGWQDNGRDQQAIPSIILPLPIQNGFYSIDPG